MIIKKEGKLTIRDFTCQACGCEFEAEPKEYDVEIFGGTKFYNAICPYCGSKVSNYD